MLGKLGRRGSGVPGRQLLRRDDAGGKAKATCVDLARLGGRLTASDDAVGDPEVAVRDLTFGVDQPGVAEEKRGHGSPVWMRRIAA